VRNTGGSRAATGVLSQLERAEPVDRLGGPVNEAVHRLLRPGRLRDLLSGTAIGHPAHPALVSAPIGCWTGAMVADVFGERRAARLLTAAGVLSAVPVAATGLSDWADTTGAEQRVGVVHMALNVTATALYTASWWARSRRRDGWGIALGTGGALLASTAGWLGGHLAYGLGVGVDTNAFAGGPTDWATVKEDRPGLEPLSAGAVSGVGVVVVRPADAGGPHVLANRCSHRGGPLAEGELVDGCIRCPWHLSEFALETGEVRRGPAVIPQPVYETRLSGEDLQARRDEPRSLRLNSARP
jgi:nitrite reductase/ring-hydroxylating ferredoxin subunit/uncharacterized membrane protein